MAKNEMVQIPKASELDTSVPDIKGAPKIPHESAIQNPA